MKGLLRLLHGPIYEHRQRALVSLISPHLTTGMRVLDVGCGFGQLGRALMETNPGVVVEGAESVAREGALIPVTAYDGLRLPFADGAYDVVIVADVLHHDKQPQRLLDDCARAASQLLIIKDHLREGFLAQQRISAIDWAANAGYGVPCLYRYNSRSEWRKAVQHLGLLVAEQTSLDLYPIGINALVGRRLHYFAVIGRPSRVARTTN